jgi:membrane protease YdiL (CAAX protease family)
MSAIPIQASLGSRFLRLFLLGCVGIAALPLLFVPIIMRDGVPEGMTLTGLVALSLIQPILLLAIAVLIGCVTAHRVGLVSLIDRSMPLAQLRATALQAVLCGVALALFFAAMDHFVFGPRLGGLLMLLQGLQENFFRNALGGMLYGGITEELLLRWGVMSLLAWAGWRLFQRGRAAPSSGVLWLAVVLAALLFAIAHLPAAMAMTDPPVMLIVRVLVLNFSAGLVFGWLYWRHNLETAMMAHASVHLARAALNWAGYG